MKYFIMKIDPNYVGPSIIGWFGKIDRNTLSQKKIHELPKHLLFNIDKHMQMVFTDIITVPCFMASKMAYEVISQYDPFLKSVRVILYDEERQKSNLYFILYLDRIKLKTKDYTEMNRTAAGSLTIEKEKIGDRVILEVEDNDKTHIIVRMDLLESILRREAVGIGIEEITIV